MVENTFQSISAIDEKEVGISPNFTITSLVIDFEGVIRPYGIKNVARTGATGFTRD